MAKETKKSSVTPLIIIVVVLAVAVGGFYALYSTSKPQANTNRGNQASTNNTSRTPAPAPANAPAGAAPVYALGQPTATVTIEEFADFQCPSCAATHPTMKDIQAAFAGNKNVRFIFRQFPLTIHDKSYEAASTVEAAGMQGSNRYWLMMDQLMTNQQQWASAPNYRELWKGYAEKIGLDVAKWEADSASVAAKGRVDLDLQRGRGLGVQSTPSVYINNRLVPFSDVNVGAMRQLIETEISNTASASSSAPVNQAAPSGNANK